MYVSISKMRLFHIQFIIHVHCPAAQPFLPFLNLSVTPGVSTVYLGRFDDGASHAIQIQRGVPFGNSTQSFVFVSVQ